MTLISQPGKFGHPMWCERTRNIFHLPAFVLSGASDFHPNHSQNAILPGLRVPACPVHLIHENAPQQQILQPDQGLEEGDWFWVPQRREGPTGVWDLVYMYMGIFKNKLWPCGPHLCEIIFVHMGSQRTLRYFKTLKNHWDFWLTLQGDLFISDSP